MFQGDPEAPRNFNLVFDTEVVEPFVAYARSKQWGPEIQHTDLAVLDASLTQRPWKQARREMERVPILVFADNFWLLATDPAQLQAMMKKFCELLHRAGLGTNLDECSWSPVPSGRPLGERSAHLISGRTC